MIMSIFVRRVPGSGGHIDESVCFLLVWKSGKFHYARTASTHHPDWYFGVFQTVIHMGVEYCLFA